MKNEFVVLLHGILRSKTDMLPLDMFLKKRGYDVINILYPSRERSLEDLVDFVRETIHDHPGYNEDDKLNFVTHSMGGIITRYYIATQRPQNLGRVVMLGPPNTGSEFADFLNDHELFGPAFKAVFGPAGQQLGTDYKHIDGDIDYPLGVIAGNKSINPLAPWVLEGEHDGIVPVARTKIEGMKDHIVIPATHSFMMFNPKVMHQVQYFLEHEEFEK